MEQMDAYEISECRSMPESIPRSLDDLVMHIDETFSEMLLRLIDEKGKSDVEVYKKANIDRKLFSKIRSKKEYQPKKSTALALAIALELSLDETKDFLMKAGYTLSNSNRFDVIIRYFIENRSYDMFVINEALFTYEQPLLGA
jgi:predicted transcriptional regulator